MTKNHTIENAVQTSTCASVEWRPESQTATDTVCPYCGIACTLTLNVQDERIVKIGSPLENATTRGNLYVKGRFGFEYVHTK